MKIVIEIPDHIYEHAKNCSEDSNDEWDAMRAIAKGFHYEERPHGEWIPCSERLPEENICDDGYVEPSDYVLVFGDHGQYGVSRYWGNRRTKKTNPHSFSDWMDLEWFSQKPIAWMPLPEPYEKEGDMDG